MSEIKYTPGPREIRLFDEAQVVVLGRIADEPSKRELVGTFTGEHRHENAALCAADPELLAACEAIDASTAPYRAEDMSPQKTYTVSRNAMILLRTAIAKAKGEPKDATQTEP